MGDDVCWLDRSNDDSHARDLIGKIAKKSVEGLPGERKEGTKEKKNASRAARYVPRVHRDVDSDNLFETFFGSNQHPGNITKQKQNQNHIHVTARTCLIFSASFSHYNIN